MIAGDPIGRDFVSVETSAPVLLSPPTHLGCTVHRIFDNGADHPVVVMERGEVECRHHVRPLTIADSPWEDGD